MALHARQKLGKYRIEKKLSAGGFATVYQAMDTIEGVRVALKIPHPGQLSDQVMKDFRHEIRLAARLHHPNILPLKDASLIDDQLVLAFPLGERSLSERLQRRIALPTALDFAHQILDALAYAHQEKIIHCDVKPENIVMFGGDQLRLTDFGIAKVAQKTVRGSGTGTVGYMAPEQAMGKPSQRSDVFSAGLILYRMFSGEWPEWPYTWPGPGYRRLRSKLTPDFILFLKRAIEPNPRNRYRDAEHMRNVFVRLKSRLLIHISRKKRSTA